MKNKENRASLVAPHNPYAVSAALVRTANWYKKLRKANPLHPGEDWTLICDESNEVEGF
jgi:hypothetical protein